MGAFAALGFIAHAYSEPPDSASETTKLVAGMITRYHISQKAIDDNVSEQLLNRFLDQVDPQKLYFTQTDIDEFTKLKTELDDQILNGDVKFAFDVYDRYAAIVQERMKLAHKLIDADHDFTLDESMVTDSDKQPWAKHQAEVEDRWRKRIKYDLLILKLDGTEVAEAKKRLHKRYDNLESMLKQIEDAEKLETYLSSLTHCFDPHSSFMSPESNDDFQIQMQLRLQGIGAALRSEDGYTTVAQVVPGGAADKDKRLQVGDKIIGVGQAEGDFTDIVEMKLSRVVRLIRGEAGTKVRLQVKPKATPTEVKVYELTRQVIELKSSEVKGEIIDTSKWLGGENTPNVRMGLINIPSFYRDFEGARQGVDNFKSTSRDVAAVLDDFKKQGGVDAVVVDLRMNGGGALSEAIEVTGLFIDEGPVVMVKELNGSTRSHDDTESGVKYGGPLVVLCNRLSASASEIFAGAIKDYGRGLVIGDTTTHGKGTVQNVMPVTRRLFRLLQPNDDRGALKLTINQFYRVNGNSTQNDGVHSDVVLPSLLDHMDLGESFMDNALKASKIDPIAHENYNLVKPEWIKDLKQNSQKRVAADEEFQKTQKRIAMFLERKNRKTVSLNEATLKQEQEEDKKLNDDENDAEKPKDGEDPPIFGDTPYNKEVLRIAGDYLQLVKDLKTAKN
jgi:carboxyl-terminal processing protease